MKKWLKVIPALAMTASLALPLSTFAQANSQADIEAKYKVLPKVEVSANTIDIRADILGAASVDGGSWEVLPVGPNKAEKIVQVDQKTKAKLHVRVEGLKPSVEYCFNIKFKGKLDGKLDAVLKLKGQKGDLFCVKTKNPGNDKPGNDKPGNDKPDNNNPGNNNPGNNNPGNNNPGNNDPGNNNPGNNNPGGKLPKTATPYATNMGIGATLLAAGAGLLLHRRKAVQ